MRVTAESFNESLIAFTHRRRDVAPDLNELELPRWSAPALEVTKLVWTRRVINEAQSVELAERISECLEHTQLRTAALDQAIARLNEDEKSHVELATKFLKRLGAPPPITPPSLPSISEEAPPVLLLRSVATGLFVCEAVSAARFTLVRQHTDLALPRACIEYFLRDEIAHAELGYLLLPYVLERLGGRVGEQVLANELKTTFRRLDQAIGLDADRKKLELKARPQPPQNAGIVEPAIDALAFYDCIRHTVLPRLSKLGIDATSLWDRRWTVR